VKAVRVPLEPGGGGDGGICVGPWSKAVAVAEAARAEWEEARDR